MLDTNEDILSDVPGVTILGVHYNKLSIEEPIRTKPYSLPFVSLYTVCKEVCKIIRLHNAKFMAIVAGVFGPGITN